MSENLPSLYFYGNFSDLPIRFKMHDIPPIFLIHQNTCLNFSTTSIPPMYIKCLVFNLKFCQRLRQPTQIAARILNSKQHSLANSFMLYQVQLKNNNRVYGSRKLIRSHMHVYIAVIAPTRDMTVTVISNCRYLYCHFQRAFPSQFVNGKSTSLSAV